MTTYNSEHFLISNLYRDKLITIFSYFCTGNDSTLLQHSMSTRSSPKEPSGILTLMTSGGKII